MAHLTDLDLVAPADSLYSGGVVLNTWRARIDVLNDALGDITSAEADQIEAIGTSTISAAQWGYLGACGAGGGQLLAALTASESTQLEAIGTTTISAAQWGYLGACVAGGGQLLAALTAAESTQLEAIGTTTISATQWGYLGALNQGLTTTSTVTFGTINAFTLGGKLTAGAVEIEGSAFDINGGTIDGITSLTAGGALDIGAYGFRALSLTADGLTATRVIFAGAAGLLSNAAAMTFVTDTLTVTKLGAFQAAGAINFDSQNMTNVDIDSGTIDGITDLAVADGGTGSSTAANARTALGVAIGSNVLAYDAGLSNLAGIAMAADKFYYTSADNTHVAGTVTAFARTILDDADAATQLGTLGLSTNLPNLADAEVTQLEAIGATTISAAQWGYLGACGAGGGQLLAALTAGESDQLELIGTTTISAAQWAHLGGLNTTARGKAYLNSAQNDLADTTWIKVLLDATLYDVGSDFADYKFTAPTTGYYLITYATCFTSAIANKVYTIASRVNNNAVQFSAQSPGDLPIAEVRVSGSLIHHLTATDYLELWCYLEVGAATVDLNVDVRDTYITWWYLGA